MKFYMVCLVSSGIWELAKLMKEKETAKLLYKFNSCSLALVIQGRATLVSQSSNKTHHHVEPLWVWDIVLLHRQTPFSYFKLILALLKEVKFTYLWHHKTHRNIDSLISNPIIFFPYAKYSLNKIA